MTKPRKSQVCLEQTPYYHCIARCVRRAFLCGEDEFSGKSFEHRRGWIIDRLKELASIFAIDIAGYAVMSNHYHVVLHVDQERASAWSADEVIERWRRLFSGHLLVDRVVAGEATSRAEWEAASQLIDLWRKRLYDIGWFMRCLNEQIARLANKEDDCKGRFWEGRYKSQALLDEAALLTCLSYVDLNPIRAGIADTPESSDYTSLQERIHRFTQRNQKGEAGAPKEARAEAPALIPFNGATYRDQPSIPFDFADYLRLVDWYGRAIRDDKRGAIPNHLAPILQRLNIQPNQWLDNIRFYNRRFHRALGAIDRIGELTQALGQKWLRGTSAVRRLYCPVPS